MKQLNKEAIQVIDGQVQDVSAFVARSSRGGQTRPQINKIDLHALAKKQDELTEH